MPTDKEYIEILKEQVEKLREDKLQLLQELEELKTLVIILMRDETRN